MHYRRGKSGLDGLGSQGLLLGMATCAGYLEVDRAQGERQAHQRALTLGRSQVALPQGDDIPAHVLECVEIAGIALPVVRYLVAPVGGARLGQCEVGAALVAVPKAAIHVDNGVVAVQHDVGGTGQPPHVQAVTVALGP